MSQIELFLQRDTGVLVPIKVNPECKVKEFRSQISQTINKPEDGFRILFQGKELEDKDQLKDYYVEDKCVLLIIEKEQNIQGCLYYPVEIIVPALDYLDGYSQNIYPYDIQNMFSTSLTFISIAQGIIYILTAITSYIYTIHYYILLCIIGFFISIFIFAISYCPSPKRIKIVKIILIIMSLLTTIFAVVFFILNSSPFILINTDILPYTLNLVFPIIINLVPLLYIERINRNVDNTLQNRDSTSSGLGIFDL